MEDLLRDWDGEEIVLRHDRQTGANIVIAVHSTRLGPATGGTRMLPYLSLENAVRDAMALSAGMTRKFAIADFPRGGGKAVIAVPPHLSPNARGDLLRGYGALVRSLGGLYETGPDVGTSSADMDIIAETGAPYVRATTTAAGGAGDSSGPTAAGVVAAIEAVLESLFGDRSPERRRFVVQGAGSVGGRVTAVLAARGGHVAVCDVDRSALDRLTSEFAVETIDPNGVYDLPCDLFVPCALGGILNQETIPRLRCRAVCGAANNQIAGPGDAGRLRARGIIYAPDYVVSLGGAVAITGIESLGWATDEATSRVVETIRNAVHRILVMADAEGITTVDAAERLVIERLR